MTRNAREGLCRRAGGTLGRIASAGAAGALIGLVRAYQVTLSPIIGRHCRFEPTCSRYFIEAVRLRGPARGAALGIWRILRCHPFSRGGYDPVPDGKMAEEAQKRRAEGRPETTDPKQRG